MNGSENLDFKQLLSGLIKIQALIRGFLARKQKKSI